MGYQKRKPPEPDSTGNAPRIKNLDSNPDAARIQPWKARYSPFWASVCFYIVGIIIPTRTVKVKGREIDENACKLLVHKR